jgi:thymidylate synthase
MKQYLDLLRDVMINGEDRYDRTGTGTRSVFGRQLRFKMSDGFPLMTTKKMFTKGLLGELLWFISGSTNVKDLQKQNIHIWDSWQDADGELGPVYGYQWRNWTGVDSQMHTNTIDQLQNAIDAIKNNPESRRIIVNSWNVSMLAEMALPPCHMMYQFYVHENGELDLQLYVRSNDLFLGAPFNIAQYAALLHMIAKITGKTPGTLVYTIGDAHIYKNHFDQVKEQLSRMPYALPTLTIKGEQKSIDDFKLSDFEINDYKCWPAIKAPVAV